jgi:8-oxo-dGTP pyrophosphatase MutT (NUDIX family)
MPTQFYAGVVAIIWRADTDTYLLVRRSRTKAHAAGKWWVVTGTVESNEGFPGALMREVREELGAAVERFVLLETTHFTRDGAEWLSAAFLCTLVDPDRLMLDDEHDAYEWVKASEVERRVVNEEAPTDWILSALRLAEQRKSECL